MIKVKTKTKFESELQKMRFQTTHLFSNLNTKNDTTLNNALQKRFIEWKQQTHCLGNKKCYHGNRTAVKIQHSVYKLH